MIRKVLFFCLISFVGLWLAIGHFVKTKFIDIISKQFTDEYLSLTYDNAKLYGFPLAPKISFKNPKINFITEYGRYDFNLNFLKAEFNYNLKRFNIIFPKEIVCKFENLNGVSSYSLKSDSDIKLKIKMIDPIYLINSDTYFTYLNKIETKINSLSFISSDQKIFDLNQAHLELKNQLIDPMSSYRMIFSGGLSNGFNKSDIKDAQIFLDLGYIIDDYDRKIKLRSFRFKDEIGYLNSEGFVNLSEEKSPYGELQFSAFNYNDILDKFDISKKSRVFIRNYISDDKLGDDEKIAINIKLRNNEITFEKLE